MRRLHRTCKMKNKSKIQIVEFCFKKLLARSSELFFQTWLRLHNTYHNKLDKNFKYRWPQATEVQTYLS